MDTIFIAPTFMSAATMAASLADDRRSDDRHLLLVTNNAAIPEVTPALHEMEGFAAISRHFDAVLCLNDYITPHHPRTYRPGPTTLAELAGRIRLDAGIGPNPHVYAQSLLVRPASALAEAFGSGPVTAVSDGLMAYGRGRQALTPAIAARLDSLLYLDLLPGVTPRLFAENNPTLRPVSARQFRKITEEVADACDSANSLGPAPDSLILGQYLNDLGILTQEQEEELHVTMVQCAIELGSQSVSFKPHPSSAATVGARMADAARDAGVDFSLIDTHLPLEVLLEAWKPAHVISNFSTGLATASGIYGVDAHTVGALDVARALPSPDNSNLVPLAICHAAFPRFEVGIDGHGRVMAPPADDLQVVIDALAVRRAPDQSASASAPAALSDTGLTELLSRPTSDARTRSTRRVRQRLVTALPSPVRVSVRKARRHSRKLARSARDVASALSVPLS